MKKSKEIDGRTRLARRAKQLCAAFETELGGALTEAQLALVRRAGELLAISEETRRRWMAGDVVTTSNDVVRLDSAARRAVRELSLPKSEIRPGQPLQEYLDGLVQEDEVSPDDAAELETDGEVTP